MRGPLLLLSCCCLFLLCFAFPIIASAAEPKMARGDTSQLPEIDYSKTVEMNILDMNDLSFSDAGGSFQTREFDMEAAHLPSYSGDLKSLPVTDWQSQKPDFYSPSIDLRDFEIKKAVEKWSTHSDQSLLDESSSLPQKGEDSYSREADVPEKTLEKKETQDLNEEKLKELINQGNELGTVQMGRGFGTTTLKPQPKETPETKSPPKSEPLP